MIAAYGKIAEMILRIYPDSIELKSPKEIKEQLLLDSIITGIDTFVLQDISLLGMSPNVRAIKMAILERNTKINIIIHTKNDKNKNKLPVGDRIFNFTVNKLNDEILKEEIESIIVKNSDTSNLFSGNEVLATDMSSSTEIIEEDKDYSEETSSEEEVLFNCSMDYETPISYAIPEVLLEDNLKKELEDKDLVPEIHMNDYQTLEEITNNLEKDKVMKQLLESNSDYMNLTDRMSILDKRLNEVMKSDSITANQKLEQMYVIVQEKSGVKGIANDILANYVNNILETVFTTAVVKISEDLETCRQRIQSLSERELYKGNTIKVEKLMEERFGLQIELADKILLISNLYAQVSTIIKDTSNELASGIPSDNPYIASYLKPIIGVAPKDLEKQVQDLFKALEDGRIKLSVVEGEIRSLFSTSAKLCDISENVIATQQELIDTMKVNKIEEVVIVDNTVKNNLRLYIGGENSGKTATVVILNEVRKRKGNTLLIDLTGKNKISNYLYKCDKLEDVIEQCNRGEFENIYSEKPDNIDKDLFIEYLKDCIQYYRYINILLDADLNSNLISYLQNYALSVTIIAQTNIPSINCAKRAINLLSSDNMARFLCMTNPAVAPTEVFSIFEISSSKYKYVPIPNMLEIAKCAIRNTNPGLIQEVRLVFEEGFE